MRVDSAKHIAESKGVRREAESEGMVRKYTKTKTIYPSDDAVKKLVFLSIQEITKKWSMPVRDWGIIIGQLMIFFADRLDDRQVG